MGEKYSRYRKCFRDCSANELHIVNEDEVGHSAGATGFLHVPNVRSCMAVIVGSQAQKVAGVHLTTSTGAEEIGTLLDRMEMHLGTPATGIVFLGYLQAFWPRKRRREIRRRLAANPARRWHHDQGNDGPVEYHVRWNTGAFRIFSRPDGSGQAWQQVDPEKKT